MILSPSIISVLACASLALSAPSLPSSTTEVGPLATPAQAELDTLNSLSRETNANITFVFLPKEEAAAQATKQNDRIDPVAGRLDNRQANMLDARQGIFFEYWELSNYQGLGFSARFDIDNKPYYIGGDWNDRITSLYHYSPDKKCAYYQHYEWNGNYCYGWGLEVGPSTGVPDLGAWGPWFNKQISCHICSWA